MMDDQGYFKYIIAVTVQQGYSGVQITDDKGTGFLILLLKPGYFNFLCY